MDSLEKEVRALLVRASNKGWNSAMGGEPKPDKLTESLNPLADTIMSAFKRGAGVVDADALREILEDEFKVAAETGPAIDRTILRITAALSSRTEEEVAPSLTGEQVYEAERNFALNAKSLPRWKDLGRGNQYKYIFMADWLSKRSLTNGGE